MRPWRASPVATHLPPPHANRAHLAAREEGPDLGVLIELGFLGRRLEILRRGHAEGVSSAEREGRQG